MTMRPGSIIFKSLLAVLLIIPAIAGQASAQTSPADSLTYQRAATLDSTLVGKSIFNIISDQRHGYGEVTIHQSQAIVNAMQRHIAGNHERKLSGYRVRIFFDNSQNARNLSETAEKKFASAYPGIPTYRTYQNPFFKVAAGDFRTRSEAIEFLQKVKGEFPGSLIIKENIEFPIADRKHPYTITGTGPAEQMSNN
uniref:SPOR domain-containing protein n=1 Tax=uncultured prokaryote TaxID=198431 RepID=A0A0H5Q362_9ZZZZ|nr:hypothetical protein [uncultured prokaryote]